MTFHVRRPSENGRRLTIVVPPRGRERATLFLLLGWTVFVPLAALTAALLLGLLKPEDTRAFVGSLMFLALAGWLTFDAVPLRPGWALPILAGQIVSPYAMYLLFLWFFLIFPTSSPIERRFPWIKYVVLVLLAAIAACAVMFAWTAFTSLAEFQRRWGTLQGRWSSLIVGFAASAPVLTGLASLVLNTRALKSRDERRRMLIVFAGALFGLGPLIGIQVYYSVTDRTVPILVAALVVVLLSLFPISFVYAVVRHRVLGIRLIFRRGVQYALVSAGFRLLLAAIIFALFLVVLAAGVTPAPRDRAVAVVIAAGVAFVVVRVFQSVSRRVMSSIDRRFFRDAYDARVVLSSLSHSIRKLLLDPDRLVNEVVDAVSAALHPRTVAFFLHETPRAGSEAGAYRCAALRCHEGVALDANELVLPESGVLAARLTPDGDTPRLRASDVFPDEPRNWAHALHTDPSRAGERAVVEKLGAILAVPISAGTRLVGMLLLGEKRSEEHYSRDDRGLLVTVAEQVGLALDYGQLARQAAREESLRKEVEIARTVQARLFPQTLPPVAGVDYSGVCRPAREVGGDSFDFISLDQGRLGIAVGDISGKGVAAALLMANLQALLRSHAPLRGDDLRDLMADINRLLVAAIPDNRFATFFYAVLDPGRRLLTYVNAGHNPPLLLRNGAAGREPAPTIRLEPTGTMLGMFPEMAFDQRQIDVAPGDLLLAYSDGVCDALNDRDEDYGDARLEAVVRSNAGLSAARLQERILDDVASFGHGVTPFDDMTLVVAKLT
jgi:sigma-B regulation protein RsbU (phosphoserine phosphatase)